MNTVECKSVVAQWLAHLPLVLDPCSRQENFGVRTRPKIRPKNEFFCYVPFLGLIFWVTFCSNSNTLTFDSKVSRWNKSLVKNLF